MKKKSPTQLAPGRRSLGEGGFFNLHALTGLLLCAATAYFILIPIRSGLAFLHAPSNVSQRTLSFEERVSYQRAIEEVYWRHRIWPKERPDPKPSLDAVMSQAQLEKKVTDYLRNSQALEDYWQRPITPQQLQAEMDRMAEHTRQAGLLSELFEALGNDPFVIAECLARPALAERLVTNWFAYDQRIHGELKQCAEAALKANPAVEQMKQLSGKYSEIELVKNDSAEAVGQAHRLPNKQLAGGALQRQNLMHGMKLSSREWDQTVQKLARIFNSQSVAAGVSPAKDDVTSSLAQIQTGVLSSLQEDENRFYATAILSKARESVKLATISWLKSPFESWLAKAENQAPTLTAAAGYNYKVPAASGGDCVDDSWTPTAGPPDPRGLHTAVWTGTEMIIWGGWDGIFVFKTGAKYNPATDSWTATSTTNAPAPRTYHTAVWTGTKMIVWGGRRAPVTAPLGNELNTGGRYDPDTDSWATTSTTGAPAARQYHTAVWTGSEMIVWGGLPYTNTGGRYNPDTDSWTATSTTIAPEARLDHTAVWTGTEMIVWGGTDHLTWFNTGGRYDASTDSWTSTSTANAPSGREAQTAVWTGSEMVAWGGYDGFNNLNTGGRYNPGTDSWTTTSTTNAPDARTSHTALWTSSEMIIWGGQGNNFPFDLNTGGKYDPTTDSWTTTSTSNAPLARATHTAIWTGSEMVVWGGGTLGRNTGGRYNPNTDSWVSTGIGNTPSRRIYHTALWTGSEMIIWGGFSPDDSDDVNTGGKYNPSTDNWEGTRTANAPTNRELHAAVWTGSEMIVWGGKDQSFNEFNTGGKYSPVTDSWMAMTTTNAPQGRDSHTAVWTGSEMIVWGGVRFFQGLNTGGTYNSNSNSWRATSLTNAPDARTAHTAVWTGNEMIIWGGYDGISNVNTGGTYNPGSDSWGATSTTDAPTGRQAHTAVWTGSEMIVWGGTEFVEVVDTGGRYDPSTDTWVATGITNAPDPRQLHSAVWSGSEMIAWGGRDVGSLGFNTGGRYDPTLDTWATTNTDGTPDGRYNHTAIWTNSEMIVWGGWTSATITNSGGSYCAQGGPTPTPTPTPRVTPRPRPTPHSRPTPP